MNRFIFLSLIAFISLSVSSCHRKFVHKIHPDFVGHWHHEETNGESWYIDIDEKSWGNISVYDADGNYTDKYKFGENPHRWRYNSKRKELTHGMISKRFKVDQLPATTETVIINGFDTIQAGKTYCIINNDYYLKTQ